MVEHIQSLRSVPVRGRRYIGVFVAVGTLLLAWSLRTQIHTLAETWRIVPVKEAFTELYFVQQPSAATSTEGEPVFQYSFAVHSREVFAREYTLVAYLDKEGERAELERWVVTINPGETYEVERDISTDDVGQGDRLDVEIDATNQRIYARFP
jgi:hypothetical protein